MRDQNCAEYDACLSRAAKRDDRSLDCTECPGRKVMKKQAEPSEDGLVLTLTQGKNPAPERVEEKSSLTEDTENKEGEKMEAEIQCLVVPCEGKVIAQGLCAKHYDAWRRGKAAVIAVKGGPFMKSKRVKNSPPPTLPETKKVKTLQTRKIAEPSIDAREALRLSRALKILVAAGVVSQEKVDQALEIAGWK